MDWLRLAEWGKSIIDRTHKCYDIVNSIDNWNDDTVRSYINESFSNQVSYCYNHIPYYQKLFIDSGLNPGDFTDISLISKIPVLTKDKVRANYDSLRSDEINSTYFQTRRSGGTTGEPIKSLISKKAAAFETFSYFKGLRWMGLRSDMTFVKLLGGSLGTGGGRSIRQTVYEYATNTINLPAFELSPDTIQTFYDAIKLKKNICLLGYSSAVNIMAQLLKEKALNLNNVELVITTSEQLNEDWKMTIQSFFNCEVRSYYGCGEVLSLGYQLRGGDESYRIPKEHVHIESDPETHELYITQLHNKAQPLIRYAVGDLGIISENEKWKIEKLIGREADLFTKRNGTQISHSFAAHSILKSGIPVKKYQYIQYLDFVIEFRYQMESGELDSAQKNVIKNMVNNIMGEETQIVFNETDNFLTSLAGKYRIAVKVPSQYN